jgi:hypothetical protein
MCPNLVVQATGGRVSATEVRLPETELERVERWRAQELERAGYERTAAAQLAATSAVDLHLAIGLVERGCPPDLALRILL